jgi:hypothetical protein
MTAKIITFLPREHAGLDRSLRDLDRRNMESRAPKDLKAAIKIVEVAIDHITGQYDREHVQRFLDHTFDAVNYGAYRGGFGDQIREHFRDYQLIKGLAVEAQLKDLLGRPPIGHNGPPKEIDDPPTEEQHTLVLNHIRLVKSMAKKCYVSSVMRDELVTFGIEMLGDLVREWDRDRNVTFGAFAKPWLRGAMRDHVRHQIRTVGGMSPDAVDAAIRKSGRKGPKRSRDKTASQWSAADMRLDEYLRGCGDTYRKADPEIKRGIAAGAARPSVDDLGPAFIRTLNERQAMIYERCILRDTPIANVAEWIGQREGKPLDVSQVSRIKAQVIRRIESYRAKCQIEAVFIRTTGTER